jgi:dienelactone hydrolase
LKAPLTSILYLHGLDSAPIAIKTSVFVDMGYAVVAPMMHYREEKDLYVRLKNIAQHFNVKAIVGSSLGGYTAFWLGQEMGVPVVLLNPALSFYDRDPGLIPKDIQRMDIPLFIYQGALDDTVDPVETRQWLADHYPGLQPVYHIEPQEMHQVNLSLFKALMQDAFQHAVIAL